MKCFFLRQSQLKRYAWIVEPFRWENLPAQASIPAPPMPGKRSVPSRARVREFVEHNQSEALHQQKFFYCFLFISNPRFLCYMCISKNCLLYIQWVPQIWYVVYKTFFSAPFHTRKADDIHVFWSSPSLKVVTSRIFFAHQNYELIKEKDRRRA